jgi:protein-S-isoprenylcysteine O-methyltransferase Ste14
MSANAPQRLLLTSMPTMLILVGSLAVALACLLRWRDNGWGSVVWIVAFVAMTAIRAPYAIRNQANVVVKEQKGIDERLLLGGMFLTMMVLPLIQLGTGLFSFADYSLPQYATVLGAIIQVPMLWMFWRSHADLGRNWSPGLEVRQEHELVTRGVYARVRHPMYVAIWLAVFAQPLLIHNWIAGALVVPAFAAMWFIRVPQEEALMRDQFGAAYDTYAARTGRLTPKLWI